MYMGNFKFKMCYQIQLTLYDFQFNTFLFKKMEDKYGICLVGGKNSYATTIYYTEEAKYFKLKTSFCEMISGKMINKF